MSWLSSLLTRPFCEIMEAITEIAIQFSQLRRIKSFSSTLNRNLIPHLQFSVPLFLLFSYISKEVHRSNE